MRAASKTLVTAGPIRILVGRQPLVIRLLHFGGIIRVGLVRTPDKAGMVRWRDTYRLIAAIDLQDACIGQGVDHKQKYNQARSSALPEISFVLIIRFH